MSYIVTFYVIFCTFKNALSLKQSLSQPVRAVIFDMDGLLLGAEKLVNHLHSHKVPMAIATNNIEQFFDVIPAYYKNFFRLFHHIVTLSDPAVQNGKPDPEIFSICMQRFQMSLEPEQVLVMEDSPRGVLGARRAGMQVVMVPDPELPEYLRINASKVLSSLENFQPSEFGLPSYKN